MLKAVFVPIREQHMRGKTSKAYLTMAQKRALRQQCRRVPAEQRAAFETAFNAWKRTWFGGGLAISSDPHTRAGKGKRGRDAAQIRDELKRRKRAPVALEGEVGVYSPVQADRAVLDPP